MVHLSLFCTCKSAPIGWLLSRIGGKMFWLPSLLWVAAPGHLVRGAPVSLQSIGGSSSSTGAVQADSILPEQWTQDDPHASGPPDRSGDVQFLSLLGWNDRGHVVDWQIVDWSRKGCTNEMILFVFIHKIPVKECVQIFFSFSWENLFWMINWDHGLSLSSLHV